MHVAMVTLTDIPFTSFMCFGGSVCSSLFESAANNTFSYVGGGVELIWSDGCATGTLGAYVVLQMNEYGPYAAWTTIYNYVHQNYI